MLLDGAVWDVRSPRLLRVVPQLDQCCVAFAGGGALYAYAPPALDDLEGGVGMAAGRRRGRDRQFHVLDARDYRPLHTHELERPLVHLAADADEAHGGAHVALVEGDRLPGHFGIDSTSCRVYEVGRARPAEHDSDIDDAHSGSDEQWEDVSDADDDDDDEHGFEMDDSDDEGILMLGGSDDEGGGGIEEIEIDEDDEDDDDDEADY